MCISGIGCVCVRSCSTSVVELPGKGAGHGVVLQVGACVLAAWGACVLGRRAAPAWWSCRARARGTRWCCRWGMVGGGPAYQAQVPEGTQQTVSNPHARPHVRVWFAACGTTPYPQSLIPCARPIPEATTVPVRQWARMHSEHGFAGMLVR